jgi:flagellar protein FlaG
MSSSTSIQPINVAAVRQTQATTTNVVPLVPAARTLAAQEPVVNRPEPAKPAPEDSARLEADLARLAPQTASLRFRVDPELNRVVVSIVDSETGDILRQIPSDEALAIAQSLSDFGSGIVRDSA